LSADIEQKLGMKSTLVEGHGGIFEVSLDDKTIFSNHKECCQKYIPENVIKEISEAISSKRASRKELPLKPKGG
jgi:hypothetical protein